MIKILGAADIADVKDSDIRRFLLRRIDQLFSSATWDSATEGYLVVVEWDDDIQSDYQFVGERGLVSDTFDAVGIDDEAFGSPFEVISHHPLFAFYEAYLQCNDGMGISFIIPDTVVAKHADLRQLLSVLQVPCADACLEGSS